MAKKASEESLRLRSPNYPAVGLREAVDRVRALVEKDGKAGAKLDLAARHIGFSGPHGTARTVLSALRKFGLTADQNGRIVPTQQAMDILHFPPNHERSVAAKRTAATSPYIYQKLLEQFGGSGNLPSPESLRAELVADWGFNPKAVDAFLTDFLDTLVYAGLLDGNQLLLSSDVAPLAQVSEQAIRTTLSPWPGATVETVTPTATPNTAMRDLTLPLMDNVVALLRVPTPLSDENFDYLVQQISILRRGLVARQAPSTSNVSPAGEDGGITLELRHRLLNLGFKPAEIARMSNADAWIAIAKAESATQSPSPQ